ncbi:MAG: lipo-like protein [Rhizobacter sp.]|nr:lipo-like protein [Rhizobacter sp.]
MTNLIERFERWIGGALSSYLTQRTQLPSTAAPTDPHKLLACIRPGDVLLVEGQTRISVAIKYLTQSTWSHAALYIGDALAQAAPSGLRHAFVEADLRHGVRAVGVGTYGGLHCRICRPVGMNAEEIAAVIAFVTARVGYRYDLKNVFDLARYLLPTPPVPSHWRRRMIALGSGDPSRAICSTLIAQAFESVRYPILPIIEHVPGRDPLHPKVVAEILHVRNYTLYVPRDFDVSPYFIIVKPTLAANFDFRRLAWDDASASRGA